MKQAYTLPTFTALAFTISKNNTWTLGEGGNSSDKLQGGKKKKGTLEIEEREVQRKNTHIRRAEIWKMTSEGDGEGDGDGDAIDVIDLWGLASEVVIPRRWEDGDKEDKEE